jgi:membrane protein required for colicin V production
MQPYDLLMLVIMVVAVLFGMWKGLAWQIASIASVGVSYFVAFQFREPVSKLIKAEEPWNKFGAMLVLFLGTSLIIWIGFGFVSESIEKMKLKSFDRQAGAILGAIKGGILCLIVTFFAVTLLDEQQKATICQSQSGEYMARLIDKLDGIMPKEVEKIVQPYLERLDRELANGSKQKTKRTTNSKKAPVWVDPSTTKNKVKGAAEQWIDKGFEQAEEILNEGQWDRAADRFRQNSLQKSTGIR